MFRKADLVLLTKMDLLPYLDIQIAALEDALARVMPRPAVFQVSARSGAGMDRWFAWLEGQVAAVGPPNPSHAAPPHHHA
jgi:hydrogenase nickel incorporation protein HypB